MKFLFVCRMSLAVAVLFALLSAHLAAAETVYIAGGNNQFGTMNLATGIFTSRGTFAFSDSADRMAGMDFASDGTLYGLDQNAELFRINTANGGLNDLGSVGSAALAATIRNGQMYFLDNPNSSPSGTSSLFAVDLATKRVTTIGDTLQTADGVLAFDNTGKLFMGGTTDNNDFLYRVNSATGEATELGDTGSPALSAGVNVNGIVYGFGANSSNKLSIFTLNTTTGAGTVVSSYTLRNAGGGAVFAAAYLPPTAAVPEPGLTLAFGLASSAGVCRFALARRGRVRA